MCAGFYPELDEFAELGLSSRNRRPAGVRLPSPTDQFISRHVMHDLIQRPPAVARRVFKLFANRPKRLSHPSHLDRSRMPHRISRDMCSIEIRLAVARGASHAHRAKIIRAAGNGRLVRVTVVALERAITGGVAVRATWVLDDFSGLVEECQRAFSLVLDRRERVCRL